MIKKLFVTEPWDFVSDKGKHVLDVDVIWDTDNFKIAKPISKFENAPAFLWLGKNEEHTTKYSIAGITEQGIKHDNHHAEFRLYEFMVGELMDYRK